MLSSLWNAIIKYDILKKVRRFFFPDTCALCGSLVGEGYVCAGCRRLLDKEATFPTVSVDGNFGIAVFGEESKSARKLIAKAKYGKSRAVSELFAEYLLRAIDKIPDGEDYFITYIPRSRKGKRRYGADQCEMIINTDLVKERAAGAGVLFRRVNFYESFTTGEQKHLAKRHRFKNAASAFVYASENSPPDKVIVIDDIITTGSSSVSCRDILAKKGAERIAFAFIQAKSGVYGKPEERKKR